SLWATSGWSTTCVRMAVTVPVVRTADVPARLCVMEPSASAPSPPPPPPARLAEYEPAMRAALREADLAAAAGDVPVGAIVLDAAGDVVAAGHNAREADQDPTAHAELVALRAASAAAGSWRLDGHVLVVTLEPCTMCAGATV